MPMTPFIGVRISWLMVARNSDLRRDASSASADTAARSLLDALALGDVVEGDDRAGDLALLGHREHRVLGSERAAVGCAT